MLPQSEKAVLVVMSELALMAVAGGDDLIEEVGSLLIERKISSSSTTNKAGSGIDLEFANQGMID